MNLRDTEGRHDGTLTMGLVKGVKIQGTTTIHNQHPSQNMPWLAYSRKEPSTIMYHPVPAGYIFFGFRVPTIEKCLPSATCSSWGEAFAGTTRKAHSRCIRLRSLSKELGVKDNKISFIHLHILLALLLGARTLLGAPGIATRSILTTSSKKLHNVNFLHVLTALRLGF